ncbi:hypothetical protein D3H55_06960 [Bacillus salacetis]|uniref:Uncharacterized protein n=1 Tax=Bacillus salacetis TaxID=2315464 RepID=A0A3A1R7G9_9BACI|nr:hypothetical protein D3H55_06960 [Bacillus salacetis]
MMIYIFTHTGDRVEPILYIKSGSTLISPDRQMFRGEKKAFFPFILLGLFDPEGLGAGAGLIKSGSTLISPDRHKTSRREGGSFTFLTDWLMTPRG